MEKEKYDLVNVEYPAPDYRRTFEKTGIYCLPEIIDGIIMMPDCGEDQEWVRNDGESLGVGGSSFAIDEMRAQNAVRTWGLSGDRNPRTGKEY
jgi:hypothetical protein